MEDFLEFTEKNKQIFFNLTEDFLEFTEKRKADNFEINGKVPGIYGKKKSG